MSESPITIKPCENKASWKKFEILAEKLNGHYAAFVPVLPGSVYSHLSGRSAFCRRHGKILPFMAYRGGRPVGRIAAIVNRTHNTYHCDRTGFFGFFECNDDPAVAHALVAKAAQVLRDLRMESMRGPYNPSINDECGLLIDGFSEPTPIGLVWNPPHYVKLLLASGLKHKITSFGYHLPLYRVEPPLRLERLATRVKNRSQIRMRSIDMTNLKAELGIIREVYNATLVRNTGFVPISEDDLESAASELELIANPSIIQIAECNGEKAGVALALPNINEFLQQVRQTPRFLRSAHMLLLLKTRHPQSLRQVAYGISPKFRDRGLHPWLSYEHFLIAKKNYHHGALGWIQEDNEETLQMAEFIGGEKQWTWEIYEMSLTTNGLPSA